MYDSSPDMIVDLFISSKFGKTHVPLDLEKNTNRWVFFMDIAQNINVLFL